VNAGVGPPDRAAIARELSRAAGVKIDAGADFDREPPAMAAVVLVGERRIVLGLDRSTRGAWLGLVLGLAAGGPDDADLPEGISPLERAVLARTLVAPVLRATLGAEAPAESAIDWENPAESSLGRTVACGHCFTVATPTGPCELRLWIADSAGSPSTGGRLDRSILAASASLAVWLDPDRAGVRLRAGDLASFEPGDILLTDLPADSVGGLPVAVGTASEGAVEPAFPALRGGLGVAGDRRAVRMG
jgi:hypothetical protein